MTQSYADYLQSSEWRAIADAAKARDNYTCFLCGATGVLLNSHHKTYERIFNERLADLVTLCADCHEEFHRRQNDLRGRIARTRGWYRRFLQWRLKRWEASVD